MEVKSGDKLGPYEILSSLGKGGMGEVWRARDSRLNREVAIKISAQQFTDRFEREAHAIASLNHTNICTLFDIGPNYLVMELIEGPTLAERIVEGPLPVDEALAIARQIADALEAAHEKNIIHRDLKPANVKIRPDGSVKVLDFGLAKANGPETAVSPDSPTMLHTPTQIGVILGTAAYMAPEQARGKTVDKRADIWSFGVVLHEMLTGKRAFEGEDLADTLASVVKSDPDLTPVPAKFRKLLAKCLQKDPKKRLRDIGDAWDLLDEAVPATAPLLVDEPRARLGIWAWIGAAGVLALAAAVVSFIHFREKPPETPLARLTIVPPEKGSFLGGEGTQPAVSPDGRQVVFEAISADGKRALWLRPLDSLSVQPLAGTENATLPFWSPDSQSIGFFAQGKLKKIPVSGGPATTLVDAPSARGGTWSQDGVIVFAPNPTGGLQQVSASGGKARPVTPVDAKGMAQRFPWFLPDGSHFLYLLGTTGGGASIRIGSLDSPTEDRNLLDAADSLALYSQGNLLYLRGATMVARPFDAKALAFTGEAIPVAEQVQLSRSYSGSGNFSVSANGVLVYEAGLSDLRLTWFDHSGKRLGMVGDAGDFVGQIKLSPDLKTVAASAREASGNTVDIWLYDVLRALRTTRFTSDQAIHVSPVWSPDGRTIVFRSDRSGVGGDLYRKAANGARTEEMLCADNLVKNPTSFSPDGKYLAYGAQGDPKTGADIWILPDPLGAPAALKPYPFMQTEFNETFPQFSPDGHWIAYQSNESGRNEVYVAPFPGPGGKRQVSNAGGISPRWRADGKELFYVAPDNRLMAAEVNAKGGSLEVNNVEPLFGPLLNLAGSYDVSADGQRFLAIVPPEGETAEPLTVVQNWTAGLKK